MFPTTVGMNRTESRCRSLRDPRWQGVPHMTSRPSPMSAVSLEPPEDGECRHDRATRRRKVPQRSRALIAEFRARIDGKATNILACENVP